MIDVEEGRREQARAIIRALQTCTYCKTVFRFPEVMQSLMMEQVEASPTFVEATIADDYVRTCGCAPCQYPA
jgi:hypothetical protein